MRVFGRVCHEGRPVEGAYVQLVGPSGDFVAEVRTDETGRFLFYPAAGSWDLVGMAPGGLHRHRHIDVAAGQSVDVELDLRIRDITPGPRDR